jgi:hypothetical protein
MTISYSARLSPWQGDTVWSLEDGCVVERRGGRERRLPLAELVSLRASTTGVLLRFRHRRTLPVPSLSYGGLRPRDQAASFAPFLAGLLAEAQALAPHVRVLAVRGNLGEPVIWIMGLMGAGALALLVFAATAGEWALGVTLAARLVFVLILAAAVLPWMGRARR